MMEASFIPWDGLKEKTLLITGATGLIGTGLVNALVRANEDLQLNLSIVALVRNKEKAQKRLALADCVTLVIGDVEQLPRIDCKVDFIIHAASQTSSGGFVCCPVETIKTSIQGTTNLLELAKEKNVSGFVFLSTMEVYGYPERGHKVTETEIGTFDVSDVRNCYPISKIMCENLCASYFREYYVPVKVLRLTQTFGPGVEYGDKRVFAEFARCAIEGKDIVLKTKGETERSYLFTEDATTAILTVLLKGDAGESYNAANESTYCSIAEMASLVASLYSLDVKIEIQDVSALGYAKTLYMDLDTRKLKALGWVPTRGLEGMFSQLVLSLRKNAAI